MLSLRAVRSILSQKPLRRPPSVPLAAAGGAPPAGRATPGEIRHQRPALGAGQPHPHPTVNARAELFAVVNVLGRPGQRHGQVREQV